MFVTNSCNLMNEVEPPTLPGPGESQGNELESHTGEPEAQDLEAKLVQNTRARKPRAVRSSSGLGTRVHDWTAIAEILNKPKEEENP